MPPGTACDVCQAGLGDPRGLGRARPRGRHRPLRHDTQGGRLPTVSGTLDSYLDEELLAATDLVVQCWTMGEITGPQAEGLSQAVGAGTGLAGWHGGIVDAFRAETRYQMMTGGQFVHHAREFTTSTCALSRKRPTIRCWQAASSRSPSPPSSTTCTWILRSRCSPSPGTAPIPTIPNSSARRCRSPGPGTGARAGCSSPPLGHSLADLEVPEVDTMIRRGMAWATR